MESDLESDKNPNIGSNVARSPSNKDMDPAGLKQCFNAFIFRLIHNILWRNEALVFRCSKSGLAPLSVHLEPGISKLLSVEIHEEVYGGVEADQGVRYSSDGIHDGLWSYTAFLAPGPLTIANSHFIKVRNNLERLAENEEACHAN